MGEKLHFWISDVCRVDTQKPKTKIVIPENTHNLEDLTSLIFAQNP